MRMGQQAEKRQDRKSNRTRQRNKRGDSKLELNDSPEIPDRGEISDIPGLPSRERKDAFHRKEHQYKKRDDMSGRRRKKKKKK